MADAPVVATVTIAVVTPEPLKVTSLGLTVQVEWGSGATATEVDCYLRLGSLKYIA